MVIISGQRLPTAEELPHSDDTPVDNELQNHIPNLLLNILLSIWGDRQDWFFGVDMAVYYDPNKPQIVPDGFLAMGVPRNTGDRGRLSYLVWQEQYVLPKLVLEVVSEKYNGEYEKKLEDYQSIGVLYYVIYNPLAGKQSRYKQRQPLEVYQLVNQKYQLLIGNPVWLPEIGLALGYENADHANWEREWLFWYDEAGQRYLTDREKIAAAESTILAMWEANEQERQAKEQERQSKEKLENYLRSMGINPDDI
ncbi:MAG: Uma2 family endonuclease [Pseudanabaena sp. M165S2SP1A06QC]|nr:Uma2 family endonuclease [Pseudanabaena sp. M165S2SP1A06QC]